MAVEAFGNIPFTTVVSGGTDAPASGTQQTWTVASSTGFPAASSSAKPPTQFHIADVALNSEIIAVINVSGTTWTVIRGAESTTPVAHGTGFSIYQVVSAGAYTQLRSTDWLNVVTQFGADPTGTADSAAAIQAALNALPAAGGVAYLPAGTFKVASTITWTGQSVYLIGDGRWATTLNFTGTGDCLRVYDATTYTTRTQVGGGVLGIAIDGTSAGNSSAGLHMGDILQYQIDIAVRNFTGTSDIGVHFDNQNYWTEQAVASIWTDNCTQDVVFDCGGASTSAGSFDRGDFTIYLSKKTFTGDCVTFQDGTYIVGGRLRIFGNISSSSSSFTQAVLTLTGSAPAGHPASDSGLAQCELDINVESDEGLAHTFRTVNYGSTSNAIVNCSGNVSFGPGNQFTQSNITTVTSQYTFVGPTIGDNTLNEVVLPGRLAVDSSASFFSSMFFGGITGATAGFRFVGAIASGTAPVSGTFLTGDVIIVLTGSIIICTAGGTPGTWAVA